MTPDCAAPRPRRPIATYDQNVATYRQTVLTAFQDVEDNLAALRILEQEAAVQDEAVKAARESVTITLNQYRAGTVNYLAVVVVQATALTNERAALTILGQRLTDSVALIKALGGGWNADARRPPTPTRRRRADHPRAQAGLAEVAPGVACPPPRAWPSVLPRPRSLYSCTRRCPG